MYFDVDVENKNKRVITHLHIFFFHQTSWSKSVGTSYVQDVIASDEYFAERSGGLTVNELFGRRELQVHVCVVRHQIALVLASPLESNDDHVTREIF